MLNFVMGRDAELVAWHNVLSWFIEWVQSWEFGKSTRATHVHEQHIPPLGMDADTQVTLILARQKMTNLTR